MADDVLALETRAGKLLANPGSPVAGVALACQWRSRYFKPTVKALAESRSDLADLATATPYSLRRGGISARLRGENAQSVAERCGTSLEMLSRHYSYEIDDFAQGQPQSLDTQWRAARYLLDISTSSSPHRQNPPPPAQSKTQPAHGTACGCAARCWL